MPKKRVASSDDEGQTSPITKKAKVKASSKATTAKDAVVQGKDAEGNAFWELSKNRRIGLSSYRSALLVNIREYYDDNGVQKPGKKGISLSLDQYRALLKIIPELNAELRTKGQEIPDVARPSPGAETSYPALNIVKKTKGAATRKANIDVTSDEDENEEQVDEEF